MLNDCTHWLTDKHFDELIFFFWAFLFFDSTRYLVLKVVVCIWDILKFYWHKEEYSHCPTVSVLLAGYNESNGIVSTLTSMWGTYPNLEIVVIDDGSTDGMLEAAKNFASNHAGVIVLRRDTRGGKASALNYGFNFASGEIIVVLDTDSSLEEHSIWALVQPFKDEKVGAVSGNLMPRNAFANIFTWFQAYEYLHSIFIGRLVSSKLNILGIVSGAYGAFHRNVWQRCVGMDVGPPEDLDFTIRIRKAGYKLAFVHNSTCYTDVPNTLIGLIKQRFRWEQGGVVRNHCRKHVGLTNLKSPNFRWGNMFLWLETFYFEFLSPYLILGYFVWLFGYAPTQDIPYILAWLYIVYLIFEFIQAGVCLFYSQNIWRDITICAIMPLLIFYRTGLWLIRLIANTQEVLLRISYSDDYVPKHVRESTWKW